MYFSRRKNVVIIKIIKYELTDLDVPIRFPMSGKQGLSFCTFHKDILKQGVSHTELARIVDRRKNWTNIICKRSI